MEVAVRDAMIYQAGFASVAEAAPYLGISIVEIAIDPEGKVRSLTSDAALDLTSEAGLEALRGELQQTGIRIAAFLCGQDFNADDPAPHIQWVVQAVQAADALGVPAVRVDSIMTGQVDLAFQARVQIFSDALQDVLWDTPGSSVALAIENHGRQGNDPYWMRGVLARMENPRVGVTLDVGNWYWYGHPLSTVYSIYEEFAPRVKATHVKNIGYPEELRESQREVGYEYGQYCCPLAEGDLDMTRIAALLAGAGYDGPLTIEDESLGKYPAEERPTLLKHDVDHLRMAIQAAGNR